MRAPGKREGAPRPSSSALQRGVRPARVVGRVAARPKPVRPARWGAPSGMGSTAASGSGSARSPDPASPAHHGLASRAARPSIPLDPRCSGPVAYGKAPGVAALTLPSLPRGPRPAPRSERQESWTPHADARRTQSGRRSMECAGGNWVIIPVPTTLPTLSYCGKFH